MSIDPDGVNSYQSGLTDISTELLQDDLLRIWLMMPPEGYGERKGMILSLRQAMIDELMCRSPIPWRERLTLPPSIEPVLSMSQTLAQERQAQRKAARSTSANTQSHE